MITPVIGRPDELIDMAVQQTQAGPAASYGPWFLAFVAFSIMMGVLLSQFIRYFSSFGFESTGRFALVVTCMVLSLLDWAIILSAEWDWFAAHYGDVRRFVVIPWQCWIGPPIGQLTVFTSQLFFAHRCYKLYDRNKFVYAGILTSMLASLGMFGVVAASVAIDPYNFPLVRNFTVPALLINLLTDFAITGLTLWKLNGHSGRSFSSHTDDILRRIQKMTVEAALPPSICALLNMSFYLGTGNKNLIFTFFGIMTPSMYVASLMFMLNSRLTIRQKLNSSGEHSQGGAGTYEFSRVTASRRVQRQTLPEGGNGRGNIVFPARTKPSYTPNLSIGVVTERIETVEGPANGMKSFGGEEDESIDQNEVKVDLEGWADGRTPSKPYSESPAFPELVESPSSNKRPTIPLIRNGNPQTAVAKGELKEAKKSVVCIVRSSAAGHDGDGEPVTPGASHKGAFTVFGLPWRR
ncbi:hypothetical protein M407DRAFT_17854 [Tulasnella calospora MUT 4182]|uniref:DUF6534 domain-containing protein n=1 Tax=Tulasnella calospora MUT 4182 TaxID=1051891 RepID=A0A0C3QWM0_9AGAM|nr:hypothetical protein M407DRAFT_17854 [Tulasnella calospora MUT 4182]